MPSVSEGRTLVELAERMDLAFDTVMIDDAWDVNTWTVGTDQNYEARDYKLLYGYLAEDLVKPTRYDVIVLPSLFGWNRLPETVRSAIKKRVEQGAGLILIHPTTGLPAPDDPKVTGPLNDFAPDRAVAAGDDLWDLSPLVGVLSDRINGRGFRDIRPDAVAGGPWNSVAVPAAEGSFIVANAPFESFPTDVLKHYRYQLGKASTALVLGTDGEPIVATKRFGKGRVVALGYVNSGLSPMIDLKILEQRPAGPLGNDHWWEYFYSLLARSIIWAANRGPELRLGPLVVKQLNGRQTLSVQVHAAGSYPAEIEASVVNEWGENEGTVRRGTTLARGANSLSLILPPRPSSGRHFVDVMLTAGGKHYDWGTAFFDLPKADEILSLSTDRQFYTRGDQVRVRVETRSARSAMVAELLDNRGRLIGRSRAPSLRTKSGQPDLATTSQIAIDVGNYLTNIGWVRVTLWSTGQGGAIVDRKLVRINFQTLDRNFGAYELIMPWYGPPTYEPWIPTLDHQFRSMGVTMMESPERNFKLLQEVKTAGFGVYWHYRQPYLEQKDKFLETGDKKYLIREPDLADDAWLAKMQGLIREDMKPGKDYLPLAYYLADESSLTAYGDPLDFSWSVPTLTKFRAWLKAQYADLAALNAEWGTKFSTWQEVSPLTAAEAQMKGNYAGWMDHRTFMEQVFAYALKVARDTVKQEDPGGRASISGTQAPGPSNAVNWFLLDNTVDYLQPYSEDDQDELHRGFLDRAGRPRLILTGFTGYQDHGAVLRHQLWHRLLHGQIGASLFWHYTAVNADFTLTEQGRDLAAMTGEFRNEGLGLLLRGAHRENCGIAVHYSLLSVRGQWITDGHIRAHELANGDSTSAHLKRFHENRSAWLQALEDAGYQYDFLTTEQIEAGKLSGYRVLILPDSIALSDVEVAAIYQFVENGGWLIVDAECGLMDGHARWQPKGRLDDLLGLERQSVRSAPTDVPAAKTRVMLSHGQVVLDLLPAEPDLRSTSGQALGAGVSDRASGGGHALFLNFWMTDYDRLRKAGTQGPRLAVLRDLLTRAAVRPVADIQTASGKPLACSEVVAYDNKGGREAQPGEAVSISQPAWSVRYLAILPEPGCSDRGTVSITLPEPRYVYDLRRHRYLGHVTSVHGALAPAEPLLYAIESSGFGGFRLSAAVSGRADSAGTPGGVPRVKAGQTARVLIRFQPASGPNPSEAIPDTAVHVEVLNPRSERLGHYGADLDVKNGRAEFSLPLALNDVAGAWQVKVREAFSHQTAVTSFVVVHH